MRLGLVERGNYKTTDYADLTGYQLEVNGFTYNFGRIIEETRQRIWELWGFDYSLKMLSQRLHFSEEKFFNRMVKNEHYGIFNRHTGAHVCLGLVPEEQTYDLVLHEMAHDIHYRQGNYEGADEVVQEMAAILAEEQYAIREFDWNPHFTAQQLLHQLNELPGFTRFNFEERWQLVTGLCSLQQISYLINRLLDETHGNSFEAWLTGRVKSSENTRAIMNAIATTSENYALYNRRLLFERLCRLPGKRELENGQAIALTRAIGELKRLDRLHPQESLTNLMEQAFGGL
ncbi:MAG TPA: hypothetical protein VH186_32660 [Chloroflexia bacterium]|nr:hypothetical protein [Chloroflexia bacterium]